MWKSASYVHGHFWKLFIRVFVYIALLYVLGFFYHILNVYAAVVLTTLASVLAVIVFELLLGSSVAVLSLAYFFVLYRDTKAQQISGSAAVVTQRKKLFLWLVGVLGVVCFFTVPVLLAAYNIGTQQSALQEALQLQNVQFTSGVPTRVFASHLFGIIFKYPASWSDATSVQLAQNDQTIVAYLVHNEAGGYVQRFILRKFPTNETVTNFKTGYEAVIKKQGGTIVSESTAGGTYSSVVFTTMPAKNGMPTYVEAHDLIAFPASEFGSKGLFTIDFYDMQGTYLKDFAALMGTISSSMTGAIPPYIPSTHAGR